MPRLRPEHLIQAKREQLSRFALTNEFTDDLEAAAPAIIAANLKEFDVVIPPEKEIPPTFFFLPSQKSALSKTIEQSVRHTNGAFAPELNFNYVFLSDDKVVTVENYFHERMHSLGHRRIKASEQGMSCRVGYSHDVVSERGRRESGNFLEEAVVDYLAARMSFDYLQNQGYDLTSKQIVTIAGGEKYLLIRESLRALTDPHPQLKMLIIQARFDASKQGAMLEELRRLYGPGADRKLLSLGMDLDEIAAVVVPLSQMNPSCEPAVKS